jgi:hypothetical protein
MRDRFVIEPDDVTLSLPKAAEELGVARNTVERKILRGELTACEIAGRLVVRRGASSQLGPAGTRPARPQSTGGRACRALTYGVPARRTAG